MPSAPRQNIVAEGRYHRHFSFDISPFDFSPSSLGPARYGLGSGSTVGRLETLPVQKENYLSIDLRRCFLLLFLHPIRLLTLISTLSSYFTIPTSLLGK